MIDIIIILCTFPDESIAKEIIYKALNERFVACVTILPSAKSFYYWENKIEQKKEVQTIFKTNIAKKDTLINFIKTHHPYTIPELLVLPIAYCDNDYLSWINKFLL